MNMMSGRYGMLAYWGPRREDPKMLAARLMRTFRALAEIHLDLARWFIYPDRNSGLRAVPFDLDELARFIANGVSRNDYGAPEPEGGYYFTLVNEPKDTGKQVILHFHGSCTFEISPFVNTVDLLTAPLSAAKESLITAPVMRDILLSVVSIWDAIWCSIAPKLILDRRPDRRLNKPRYSQAWIAFLSARFAPLITPPKSVISDRTPDGGLLMIAAEERFDLDNPKHMAAALEIEDALMPVNALPWPQPQ